MSRADDEKGASEGPVISIVIPCFNYARYVEQAIGSALAQRHPRTEVIVVNDGSTDDSLALIRKYADRVTVIDQKNAGHVASCNAGW
ncbi:MAG TPA: glycosyltransferase family A protein, partial [Polyangia bacterium]|nr:glycosyltransferase family A protein [Polyangia bacterium]